MKKYLILFLMLFASPAFATYCGSNTDHPGKGPPYWPNNCNDPPPPPTSGEDPSWWNENHNRNDLNQHQTQTTDVRTTNTLNNQNNQSNRLENSGNSSNRNNNNATANGGRSDATSTSAAFGGESRSDSTSDANSDASANNSGGNSAVTVDTSDRSVTNVAGARTKINTFIPGDLPSNAMTIAPGAYITVAGDNDCGVLQTKVQVPVYQWNKRGKKKVLVGYDEDLAPVFDSNGVQIDYQPVYTGGGSYYMRGSKVTYVFATKGSSASGQIGLQGYAAGGGGGLSAGSGRSYSEAGTKMVIRSCIAYKVDPAPAQAPRPAYRPKAKRKIVRRAPASCVERAATTCPAK